MPSQNQIRQDITNRIIAALEQDAVPFWRRPWRTPGRHRNAFSQRPYSGVNVLLLQMHALEHSLSSRQWGTFNQWRAKGCTVKKRPAHVQVGRWGCSVVFAKQVSKKVVEAEEGVEDDKRFFVLKTFTVFNSEQVDGWAAQEPEGVRGSQTLDFEPADELILATGAELHFGGSRACYRRPTPVDSWPRHTSGDVIEVPHKSEFDPPGSYFETVFHELAHWSEVRLGWTGSYALGELIAELSACMTCQELGVPQRETLENHAAYIRSWLAEMKQDSSFILKASSQASKVAEFLLSFAKQAQEV